MVIKTGEEFIKYINKIYELKDSGKDKQVLVQEVQEVELECKED